MELLNPVQLKPRVVPVEIAGFTAHVRVMSGRERDAWLTVLNEHGKRAEGDPLKEAVIYGHLVATCVCTADGTPIFQSTEEAAAIDARYLNELFDACYSVNRIGQDGKDAEKKA